jgi:hypothetical protein
MMCDAMGCGTMAAVLVHGVLAVRARVVERGRLVGQAALMVRGSCRVLARVPLSWCMGSWRCRRGSSGTADWWDRSRSWCRESCRVLARVPLFWCMGSWRCRCGRVARPTGGTGRAHRAGGSCRALARVPLFWCMGSWWCRCGRVARPTGGTGRAHGAGVPVACWRGCRCSRAWGPGGTRADRAARPADGTHLLTVHRVLPDVRTVPAVRAHAAWNSADVAAVALTWLLQPGTWPAALSGPPQPAGHNDCLASRYWSDADRRCCRRDSRTFCLRQSKLYKLT